MREPSAGRLALSSHSMLVVEACSATTARGASFVWPHCASRITKIHSAAAPAQSPLAALIGYDGTTLFHHAACAASYTARSATLQTTPQATPGAVSTRQGKARRSEDPRGQARKSGSKISSACNTIMYDSTLFYTTSLGPPVGDPTAMYTPPLRYKREALAVHTRTDAGLSTRVAKTLSRLRQYNTQWT